MSWRAKLFWIAVGFAIGMYLLIAFDPGGRFS